MKIQKRLRIFSATRSAIMPRLVFVLLMVLALGLLSVQISSPSAMTGLRIATMNVLQPLFSLTSMITQTASDTVFGVLNFASLSSDNARLIAENQQLKIAEQNNMRLMDENTQLRKSLHVVEDLPSNFVTARVISDTSSEFVRSVIVNAGAEQGIKRGYSVLSDGHFVGRVTEVGTSSSRILLITDFASRIPVVVGDSSEQGILSGDNSDTLKLQYITQPQSINAGDMIITSGKGGGVPAGLPVARIDRWDGLVFRSIPNVDLPSLRYVQIVDYGLMPMLEQFDHKPDKFGQTKK